MIMLHLEEILKLWQQQTPLEDVTHLRRHELQGLAQSGDDDQVFAHLALCTWCRQRLWRLQSSIAHDVFDYVEPLAADVGIPQEVTWITKDGRYRIELRRLVGTDHKAVLIVKVKSSLDFEGKTLVVEDAHGREILRGAVDSEGLVASEIEDIRAISFQEFIVTEA
jgi:hypothetical protein